MLFFLMGLIASAEGTSIQNREGEVPNDSCDTLLTSNGVLKVTHLKSGIHARVWAEYPV